jgi:hypothetical protein
MSDALNRLPPLPKDYNFWPVFHFKDSERPEHSEKICAKDREHAIAIAVGDRISFDSVEVVDHMKVQS